MNMYLLIKMSSWAFLVWYGNILDIQNKYQLGYMLIQDLSEKYLADISEHFIERTGLVIYFYLPVILFLVGMKMLDYFVLNPPVDLKDDYTLSLKHTSKEYLVQVGIYPITGDQHPSMENYQPIKISKEGDISPSEYRKNIGSELKELLKLLEEYPDLQFQIIRIPGEIKTYAQFMVMVYVLFYLSDEEYSEDNPFLQIEKLEMKDKKFRRLKLNQYPRNKIPRLLELHPRGFLILNPKELQTMEELSTFELGSYEFDLFHELLEHYGNEQRVFVPIRGQYYIGHDLQDLPVNIDRPANTLYIGDPLNLPGIMNFEYLHQSLLVTDDRNLVNHLQVIHQDTNVVVISQGSSEVHYNPLSAFETYPRYVRQVLQIWEELIPGDNKTPYWTKMLAPILSEFLELQNMFSNQEFGEKHSLSDLMELTTYREYMSKLGRNPAIEVRNKFSAIFTLPLFNASTVKTLEDFLAEKDGYRILLLENMSHSQVIAVFSMFLVMKEHALLEKPVVFSFAREGMDFEQVLSSLANEISFRDVLLHMRSTGHVSNWVHVFALYLCDASHDDERLRNFLFPRYPRIKKGILLNLEHRDRAVLKLE